MKFFIIIFTSFIINILRNSVEEKNRIYTSVVKYNIKSLISSILIKKKDITLSSLENIINNYNRLLCDDDINNIYTLFW